MSAAIDEYMAGVYWQRDLNYALRRKWRKEYNRICRKVNHAWEVVQYEGGALFASDKTWNEYEAMSNVKRNFERNNL